VPGESALPSFLATPSIRCPSRKLGSSPLAAEWKWDVHPRSDRRRPARSFLELWRRSGEPRIASPEL